MTKFSFTLKNINIYKIEQKYSLSTLTYTTTKISELASTPITQNYTFLDETMHSHSCIISLSKLLNKELPTKTNIHCFWCKHAFKNPPIGCPIEYISSSDTFLNILFGNYSFLEFSINIDYYKVFYICFFTIIALMIAAIYPANKASKFDPIYSIGIK